MHSYIPVTDLARAREFYEQKVGLSPAEARVGGVIYGFGEHTACFMYPTLPAWLFDGYAATRSIRTCDSGTG